MAYTVDSSIRTTLIARARSLPLRLHVLRGALPTHSRYCSVNVFSINDTTESTLTHTRMRIQFIYEVHFLLYLFIIEKKKKQKTFHKKFVCVFFSSFRFVFVTSFFRFLRRLRYCPLRFFFFCLILIRIIASVIRVAVHSVPSYTDISCVRRGDTQHIWLRRTRNTDVPNTDGDAGAQQSNATRKSKQIKITCLKYSDASDCLL